MSLLFADQDETTIFFQLRYSLLFTPPVLPNLRFSRATPGILANPAGTLVLFSKTAVLTAQVYSGGVYNAWRYPCSYRAARSRISELFVGHSSLTYMAECF